MDEIHFWPNSPLFQVIQFRRETLPVGGAWEHVSPVVIKSRSCLSTSMSSKYQFMGYVSHNATFLLTPVTTLHLTPNALAQCSINSLNVTLSGPTASTQKLSLLSRPFTIMSAMSSACTYCKKQLPSPGIAKKGNFFTKQAVLLIKMPQSTILPKIAHGLTIPHPSPDSLRCCQTFAFSLMYGNGESSEVCVCDVQITFFTPASLAQSISNLEFQVTLYLLKPRVLSQRTQQV